MTKQEILDGLEGLKDMVNHVGKQTIDALKAGVSGLEESAAVICPEVYGTSEKEVVPEPQEEKPFVSGGRFAEKKTVPHGTKKKK